MKHTYIETDAQVYAGSWASSALGVGRLQDYPDGARKGVELLYNKCAPLPHFDNREFGKLLESAMKGDFTKIPSSLLGCPSGRGDLTPLMVAEAANKRIKFLTEIVSVLLHMVDPEPTEGYAEPMDPTETQEPRFKEELLKGLDLAQLKRPEINPDVGGQIGYCPPEHRDDLSDTRSPMAQKFDEVVEKDYPSSIKVPPSLQGE